MKNVLLLAVVFVLVTLAWLGGARWDDYEADEG